MGIDQAEGAIGGGCESECKSESEDRWAGGVRAIIAAYAGKHATGAGVDPIVSILTRYCAV